MPYQDIAKGGISVGLLLILAFLVNWFMQKDKARDTAVIKSNEDHQKFVESVMEDSKKREQTLIDNHKEEKLLLMTQLDKYNDSLKEISMNIKAIPKMQEDINELKSKIC